MLLLLSVAAAHTQVCASAVHTAGDGTSAACARCPADWQKATFVGVGPHNQSDLCGLVDTCAEDVAHCDFTQPPDQVFATCTGLANKPKLANFTGRVTGTATSAWYINSTVPSERGAFLLFIAPQTSGDGDFSGWACSYVFSYLATQGIATFVATIPNPADASRDNWNRVPSAGERPYPYTCAQLNQWGPGCDNSSDFLHDRHIEDVLLYAESLGYDAQRSVWWGYSEGGAMASAHLNYRLHHNSSQPALPQAVVLESTGGQYCYAFRPEQEPALKSMPYWNECVEWSTNNCCPKNLTEQYFFEHPDEYHRHPPVLLVGGNSDSIADPNGVRFYHDSMRQHAAPSATATWEGSRHGISPVAFGFAASFVKNALLGNGTGAAD